MNEQGWVIEATGRALRYWDGTGIDELAFTDKHENAVRFARFQDAEGVKYHLLGKMAWALRSVEHAWVPAARPASEE